ncbi:uncharacterized protein [Nicotiana tomentosiformis]|uniref:uncharacterized protein n=1 Tax=Nicotiana tomentosiformis TaxID=4098 RepID=UPI00388CBFEE
MPKFNLYDGRGDPLAHLRGYCSEMISVGRKDELLITYFSESLSGATLEWYTHQSVSKWYAWDDMAQDFVRHFQYNIDIILDRSSLSKMEKKPEENFREFGLRWREQAARVSPPIDEEEMVKLFLQAQGPTYFSHLISALGKPFNDVVKMEEIVEEGIKSGKIKSYSALKDAADTSQSPLPVHNKTHMVGMICVGKEYENSSEFLGEPLAAKFFVLSVSVPEVDLKNELAKGTQKLFAKVNVTETYEGPTNVDVQLSG